MEAIVCLVVVSFFRSKALGGNEEERERKKRRPNECGLSVQRKKPQEIRDCGRWLANRKPKAGYVALIYAGLFSLFLFLFQHSGITRNGLYTWYKMLICMQAERGESTEPSQGKNE